MLEHEVRGFTNSLNKFAIDNGLEFMWYTDHSTAIMMFKFYNPKSKKGYIQGVTPTDIISCKTNKLYEMIAERVKKELLDETAEKVNQSA